MIIAVDFDGILCEDEFPGIGRPVWPVVNFVRALIDGGHEVILWTSRSGRRLEEAVRWCEGMGLRFCAVNDNAPSNKARWSAEYPDPPRKVYADLYLEDHCPFFLNLAEGRHRSAVERMLVYAEKYVSRYGGLWDMKEKE